MVGMVGMVAIVGVLLAPLAPPTFQDARKPQIPVQPSAVVPRATLADQPPDIDGRTDDPVWQRTPPLPDFVEWSPTEGKPARFPTQAKIAYDRANLYILIRSFDPHPDSIIRLIGRRDDFPQSDRVVILLDSYHDRRTGFEFGVTAAGGRYDAAIYDDGNEDGAWDAVWDVATRIDSLGWVAEFRIPLSQLHYGPQEQHTFGIAIDRDIYRYNERVSWPLFRQSAAGLVSQFTDIAGLDGLEAPRRMELAPYAVTKNVSHADATGFGRRQEASLGADLKYRVASNVTLDATINPDFGQVEADPGVLNLTAYETFFPEKRPFFVAGRGLFQMPVNCNQVNCGSDGLFYSRRIGRAPQLAGTYNDTTSPAFTTILGAGKLTGRWANGLRLGALGAYTQRMTGVGDRTIEPATSYGVFRLDQDYGRGEGTVGAMLTAVDRWLDAWSTPYLPSGSYAGAMSFRQRFLKRTYEVSGLLSGTRVSGSAPVIGALQRSSVHYYQRPDAGLPYDTMRTSLAGDAEEVRFGKVAGKHLMFQTALQRQSPGYEINDLGYLQRAGTQSWSTWAGWADRTVRRAYQSFNWNWNWWQIWTTEGLPLERAFNTNAHATLRNNWNVNVGGTIGQLGATYSDRAARGGPAVAQDPYLAPWTYISGDDRRKVVPELFANLVRGQAGHRRSVTMNPGVTLKVSSRFTAYTSFDWEKEDNGTQWYGRDTDTLGVAHYGFARLKQTVKALTTRVGYTISPVMTLQVYVQPFVAKGTYSRLLELSATPRAARYDDRFRPYFDTATAADPGGFNYKQFRSSVVYRWEYLPGSTLFAVWTQGRQDALDTEGSAGFAGDLRDLLERRPDNTFLVKVSYWLNR